MVKAEKIDMDWPGWSVEHNPLGKKFDASARKRMVAGSQMLLPFFKKYYKKMGKVLLEYGPFFNPLLIPLRFPDKQIFYWERRASVRKFIVKAYGPTVTPLSASFTTFSKTSLKAIEKRTKQALDKSGVPEKKFDSVVASQCFNYMDYKAFLDFLPKFCKKGTLLFVNNAAGYGVAKKFSKKGTKNNKEMVEAIRKAGFSVVEKKSYDIVKKSLTLERMIVVARFKGQD
jgi:hypothetical protein